MIKKIFLCLSINNLWFLIMELSILVSGRVAKDTEKVHKNGQMEQFMRDIGKMIWLTEKVPSCTCMVTSIKATGKEIKPMVKERILTAMGLFITESGKTICNTDLEQKLGEINQNTRVNIRKAKSTE